MPEIDQGSKRKKPRLDSGQSVGEKPSDHKGRIVTDTSSSHDSTKAAREKRRVELLQERKRLPISAARVRLMEEVRAHDCLIVVGETGSGKTTQIPQFLLEGGFAGPNCGAIAITQPRRVAAITSATRVSQEMGTLLGQEVGYSIRFDDVTTPGLTRIKYVTDGMLLREALLDPLLTNYSVVILDEAHERTVQTDVLLGVLKGVLRTRQQHAAGGRATAGDHGQGQGQADTRHLHGRDRHQSRGEGGSGTPGGKNGPILLEGRPVTGTENARRSKKRPRDNVPSGAHASGAHAAAATAATGLANGGEPGGASGVGGDHGHQSAVMAGGAPLPALKLIVMSATLDAGQFSAYFGDARAVYVQGRQFPVQVLYTLQPEADYLDAVLTTVLQVNVEEGPGDILAFLTGQEEIESLERLLVERGRQLPDGTPPLLVTPIFAALPPEQQMAVFAPTPRGMRKVVLATNIAETSLTIPGIRFVVDPGLVKMRAYSPKTGVEALLIQPVSQAQARQRSGRAGREAPGKCFRLFTEDEFHKLRPVTTPEIQRCNVASVVLQLKALGIHDVLHFDFMDKPSRAALVRSLEQLFALGALDGTGRLTDPLGRHMACLPLDPCLAKCVLTSPAFSVTDDMLVAVAMLSVDTVFFAPKDRADKARAAKRRFLSAGGDHATLVSVFRAYQQMLFGSSHGVPQGAPPVHLSSFQVERPTGPTPKQTRAELEWCKDNFVNMRTLRRAVKVYQQVAEVCGRIGIKVVPSLSSANGSSTVNVDHWQPLCRCLVTGFFANIARRQPDGSYCILSNRTTVAIHPSSVLFGQKPDCVLFHELISTTKQYIRCVSMVEPSWLAELAPQFYMMQTRTARPS